MHPQLYNNIMSQLLRQMVDDAKPPKYTDKYISGFFRRAKKQVVKEDDMHPIKHFVYWVKETNPKIYKEWLAVYRVMRESNHAK